MVTLQEALIFGRMMLHMFILLNRCLLFIKKSGLLDCCFLFFAPLCLRNNGSDGMSVNTTRGKITATRRFISVCPSVGACTQHTPTETSTVGSGERIEKLPLPLFVTHTHGSVCVCGWKQVSLSAHYPWQGWSPCLESNKTHLAGVMRGWWRGRRGGRGACARSDRGARRSLFVRRGGEEDAEEQVAPEIGGRRKREEEKQKRFIEIIFSNFRRLQNNVLLERKQADGVARVRGRLQTNWVKDDVKCQAAGHSCHFFLHLHPCCSHNEVEMLFNLKPPEREEDSVPDLQLLMSLALSQFRFFWKNHNYI